MSKPITKKRSNKSKKIRKTTKRQRGGEAGYGNGVEPPKQVAMTHGGTPQDNAVNKMDANDQELNDLNNASDGGAVDTEKTQTNYEDNETSEGMSNQHGGQDSNGNDGEIKKVDVPLTYDDPAEGTDQSVSSQVGKGQETVLQGQENSKYDEVDESAVDESQQQSSEYTKQGGGMRRRNRKTKRRHMKKKQLKKTRKSKQGKRKTNKQKRKMKTFSKKVYRKRNKK